jgi:hypothetical protein
MTNNVPQLPDTIEPLVNALPPWLGQIVFWMAMAAAVLAPFRGMISRGLANLMNKAAASSQLDDDEFLRRLFSMPWYQTVAVLLRFVSIDLPTLAMLERAITLQKEAVAAAVGESKPTTPPNV